MWFSKHQLNLFVLLENFVDLLSDTEHFGVRNIEEDL